MKKYLPIYSYGAIIILAGIFLLFSEHFTFGTIKLTLGITLMVGAILASVAGFSIQKKQVEFSYHEMHALAMFVYGISVLAFCNTFDKLISVTAFIFIFYSFSEIIFCIWLFNLGQKVVYKTIIVRFVLGLAIGFGAIVSMNFSNYTLEGFGVLFVMVGINTMLYNPVIKGKEFSEIEHTQTDLLL